MLVLWEVELSGDADRGVEVDMEVADGELGVSVGVGIFTGTVPGPIEVLTVTKSQYSSTKNCKRM